MTPTDETTNLATSPWSHSLSGFGIHRIDASRRIFTSCNIGKEVVEFVVKEYRKTTKDTSLSPELQEWKPRDHFNFRLKIFCFKKQSPNHFGIFLNNLGAPENFGEISYYFVCFIYRDNLPPFQEPLPDKKKWDIFALTLGDGWRVVKAFSDYIFPIKIALRVVDPNLSIVESKPLAGHKEASTETYRQAYCLEPHELDTLWHIFKQFKAHFKMKSSMFTLDPFKEDELIGVEIGRGKILIIKRIPFDQMPIILDHFSKIYRGEKTHQEDGSEETDDPSFKYLHNISPVDEDTSEQLNSCIIELIYECLKDPKRTLHFSFIHKYYKTFFSSHSFRLVFRKWEETWNYPPDMCQILETLRAMLKGFSLPNSQQLASLLDEMYFKFGTTQQKHSLLEFFEGELRQKEKTYFRNEGVWLVVRPSHLVVLQHDFHSLLSSCLIRNLDPSRSISGALPLTWISKERWAAFSLEHAIENELSLNELEIALEALQNQQFSFVEDGNIKVKVPTFCLLTGIPNSLAKTIEKKWAELSYLLDFKASTKEKLMPADLAIIFPDKQDDDQDQKKEAQSTAKKVYKLLTEKRPICAPPSVGQTKKAPAATILNDKGDVLFPDITYCEFKSKALQDHQDWVQKQLTKKQVNRERFINELALKKFKETKKGNAHKIGTARAKSAYEELTKPIPLNITLKGLFCIRAPIKQKTAGVSDEVYEFLHRQHKNYQRICKEEGYNRAYLGKEGFIVGDQLYAGKREKVELFDILYHDKAEGKLYLYHVKEEFGQPTRAACAQIRVAAHSLASDIASGSFSMLKQFYANCTKSKSTTVFREKVKEQFNALSPDNPDDPEEFIRLFRDTPSENIIFVYAFIDTAEGERRLEDEANPTYTFSEKDFEIETLDLLKSHNYLDEEGKITAKLLRSTKKPFVDALKVTEAKQIYFKLHRKISKFDSMSAKVELLHLRDDLMHKNPAYSFGFKICQIRREGNFDESELPFGTEIEIKDQTKKSTISDFEYKGQSFEVDEIPATSLAIMKEILGVSSQMPNYEFKYLFEIRIRKQSQDSLDPLLKEKKIGGASFEDRVNTYVERIIKPASFAEIDFKIAASLANVHLISLEAIEDEEEGFVIDKTTLKEITPHGSRVCCLVEHDNGKFLSHPTKNDFHYTTCIDDEDVCKLFANSPQPIGIVNPDATYCFLNSALQLIFHTPLFKILASKDRLAVKDSDLDTKDSASKEKERKARLIFYEALKQFGLEYYLTEKEKKLCQAPISLRSALSELVIRDPDKLKAGQQDAAEVFDLLFKCYNLNKYELIIEVNQQVDRSKEVDLGEGDSANYSQITQKNTLPSPVEKSYILQLPIPNKSGTISFDDCLDAYLKDEETSDKLKYLAGKHLYESQAAISREVIQLPEQGLLMSFKRFDNDLKKIPTFIEFKKTEITIKEKVYRLSFFIEHLGDTMKGGHYIAYGKIKDRWFLFNDGADPKEKSDDEILNCVKRAYILYFK